LASAVTNPDQSIINGTAYTSDQRQPVTPLGSAIPHGSVIGSNNVTDNANKDIQDYTDVPIGDGISELKYRYNKDNNNCRQIVSQGSNRSRASSKSSRKLRNAVDRQKMNQTLTAGLDTNQNRTRLVTVQNGREMNVRKNSLVVEDIHSTLVPGSRFVETAGIANRPIKLPPIASAE